MPQAQAAFSRTRQAHHEPGPLLCLAFDFNPAAVKINDAMHGRKPQTRAFFLRGEEREKNLVQIRRGDAFAGVLEGNFNDVTLAPCGIDVTASGRNRQLSALRHGIKGIGGEVPKHLPHLVLVDLSQEGTARQSCCDGNLFSIPRFMLY